MRSDKIIKKLLETVPDIDLKHDELYRKAYSYDATGIEGKPDYIIFPRTESQISSILQLACEMEVPVTPRGSGAGFTGGSIAVNGGILLCFSKMNKILHYDKLSSLIVLEPGVITSEINKFARRYNTYYPVDPASMEFSTIGGNAAENAGGPRAVKYGTTREYVLGLNLVLAEGKIIKTGARTIKNVAGYDLTSLIVGSEGTLGIISRIILKLIPIPESRKICLVLFDDKKQAAEAITSLKGGGVNPSCLEFLDKNAFYYARKPAGWKEQGDIDACVILEWDGDRQSIQYQEEKIFNILQKQKIMKILFPDESLTEEDIWQLRKSVSPAIVKLGIKKINEDIVVPVSKIADALEHISGVSAKYGLDIINFGHLGDGNIHTNIILRHDTREERSRVNKCLEEIFDFVIKVDGSISGEHGIGMTKREYLKSQYGELEINIMKGLKSVFDPKGIMNPGKMFI